MQKVKKILFPSLLFLFVFSMPTQLAKHFWPEFSKINGIRVDYLSPKLYLTDIVAMVFIVVSIFSSLKTRTTITFKNIRNNKTTWFLILGAVLVNVLFSLNPTASVLSWIRVCIYLLTLYALLLINIKKNRKTLIASIILSSFICLIVGLLQFINQKTTGTLFYYLGERSFNAQTSGVALFNFFGHQRLRAYSIFPHPNVFAAYITLQTFLLYYLTNNKTVRLIIFVVLIAVLFITASRVVTISLAMSLIMMGLFENYKNHRKLIISVAVLLIGGVTIGQMGVMTDNLPNNINERIVYSKNAKRLIEDKYLTGVGLGNYLYYKEGLTDKMTYWQFQPVHNTYLFLISEFGVVIPILLLMFLYYRCLNKKNNFRQINMYLIGGILFVLISGTLDHYWYNIKQTNYLFILFLSIVFNKQINKL